MSEAAQVITVYLGPQGPAGTNGTDGAPGEQGPQGIPGTGIPDGGNDGEVISKASGSVGWSAALDTLLSTLKDTDGTESLNWSSPAYLSILKRLCIGGAVPNLSLALDLRAGDGGGGGEQMFGITDVGATIQALLGRINHNGYWVPESVQGDVLFQNYGGSLLLALIDGLAMKIATDHAEILKRTVVGPGSPCGSGSLDVRVSNGVGEGERSLTFSKDVNTPTMFLVQTIINGGYVPEAAPGDLILWNAGVDGTGAGRFILAVGGIGGPGVAGLLYDGVTFHILKPIKQYSGENKPLNEIQLAGSSTDVANTSVTGNSRIFLTRQGLPSNPGHLAISALNPGVGFAITSTDAAENGLVTYWIVEGS